MVVDHVRGDGGRRPLGFVRLPVKNHDFLRIDFHGQAVCAAQFHVKIAVCPLGLLYGLDLNGAALHVIGQGHARPARDLLSDLLHGDIFPGFAPLGFPERTVRRDGHAGNGARYGPAGKIEVVQDKGPAGQDPGVTRSGPVHGLDGGRQGVPGFRKPGADPRPAPVMDRNVYTVRLSAGRVRIGHVFLVAAHFTGHGCAVPGQIHIRPPRPHKLHSIPPA